MELKMPRALLFVLDSFGIGGAPDASDYGDAGSDTFGHIAAACAADKADVAGARSGLLWLPNLARLGLAEAARLATGSYPDGFGPSWKFDRSLGRGN